MVIGMYDFFENKTNYWIATTFLYAFAMGTAFSLERGHGKTKP